MCSLALTGVTSMSDPASSASLDELVRMNIAGDIEAVISQLEASVRYADSEPDVYAAASSYESEVLEVIARLRRIAAGIREAQG